MDWGIVIGVDEYNGDVPRLSGAVRDAVAFYNWLVSDTGGRVRKEHVNVLLGRASGSKARRIKGEEPPRKDNIMRAINDVIQRSDGTGERFFFYFSGHGLTSMYANREESAIAAADFDDGHPDRTLAVRSILEFFETTRFGDQFFFFDACRVKPRSTNLAIGGWTIPRRRDPGQVPVQQFVLYATLPDQEARERGWADEAVGAFSSVLVPALRGKGRAKAWSWEANCYEVRWERLVNYVKRRMRTQSTEDGWVQVPQDAGCRGVLNRDRDARLATFSGRGAALIDLKVELKPPSGDAIDLSVVDGAGDIVQTARRITGPSYTFRLPSRTYAVRATAGRRYKGRLPVPVELSDDPEDMRSGIRLEIDWDAHTDGRGDAKVTVSSPDPLAVAEVRDQTEGYVRLARAGVEFPVARGLYVVRELGPEPRSNGVEQQVIADPGKPQPVPLPESQVDPYVTSLANALGGSCEKGCVIPFPRAEPIGWAQPSTILAVGLGAVIHDEHALTGIGLESPLAALGDEDTGVALLAVAKDGNDKALRGMQVRAWPAGDAVPPDSERRRLEPSDRGVAQVVWHAGKPGPYWLSIEPADAETPTVVALPVLERRLATLVVQLDPGRLRLYQFHPLSQPHESNEPGRMRRVEHLQRVLVGGRADTAETLAGEVAGWAHDDPIAACLAGYVLLRLGSYEPLDELAAAVVAVAPKLSDAYILRAEYEAHNENLDGRNQAIADAVSTGVPVFAEGLTRLVEGIRATGFFHPRGALVRYIFQQHSRGSMWSAFTPRGRFEAGRLVITGADVGYEG
jgi:hypothetical protein